MSLISKYLLKGSKAGAFVGAGYLGSALIGSKAEEARAYYGEAEAQARFGSHFDNMAGASKFAGYAFGGLSLINSKAPMKAAILGPVAGAMIAGIGYTALGNPIGTAATIGATAIAAPFMVKGSREFLKKVAKPVAIGTGFIAAGAAIGLTRRPYAAAEGNVTSVEYDRESTVNRLNYNTAGIVQALHKNRRM